MILPAEKNYPKRIHVGDTTYRIKFVKSCGKNTLGLCDGTKEIIYIRKGLGPAARFKTLIHEILHAIEFSHGIPLKHSKIRLLEEAIADIFIQNF